MENNNNKTLIIVIIAILAAAACLLLTCCAGTLFLISKADPQSFINTVMDSGSMSELIEDYDNAEITASEEIPEEQTDPNMPPIIDEESMPEKPASDELTASQKQIMNIAEKIRGLKVTEPLLPVYKTKEELREYLLQDFSEITDEDYANDLAMYNILGFAPEDFDLKQFDLDLYTEQIAGFYDEKENTMNLVSDLSDIENDRTLAHEYTHYMQFNNDLFSNVLKYDEDYCIDHSEECLIFSVLSEGDATLTQELITQDPALGLNNDTVTEEEEADSSVFDNAPKYFQDSLLFPYAYGFDFVLHFYLKGGFEAINDLYLDPPESIEQIIHPEKYGVESPISVNMDAFTQLIEENGEIITASVFNENDIFELLNAPWNESWALSERQAIQASEGWGGGEYIFAKDTSGQPLFFSKTVWDSVEDAKEAEEAFKNYNNKRFTTGENGEWSSEKGETVYLIRQDDITFWTVLPQDYNSSALLKLIRRGNSL